jgi:hypothetical protein
MRSIESENIKDLPMGSSPYTNRTNNRKHSGNWTPISISSGEDDDEEGEGEDKIGGEVCGCE